MAYWLKCWPAIERLQVQAPISASFFRLGSMNIFSSALKNEEVFVTTSFEGDVKLSSWLILATSGIPPSSLVMFGKTFVEKESNNKTYKNSTVTYFFIVVQQQCSAQDI